MHHDEIRVNAQTGNGSCSECPAYHVSEGEFVNPGLGNSEGEIVFVTDEPRHPTDWAEYESWAEYNAEWFDRFKEAQGGKFIRQLLSETDATIDDVWITDSLKCPTKGDERREIPSADTDDSFAHCRSYLDEELDDIGPQMVVTLGKRATTRTLMAMELPDVKARYVRVTTDYGTCVFEMPYPLVISLHWAQRTLPEEEWVPVVQDAIASLLSTR